MEKDRWRYLESYVPLEFREVRKKLSLNPDVFYAGNSKPFHDFVNMFCKDADIIDEITHLTIISPRQPIFDINQLNSFMDNVIPKGELQKEKFRYDDEGGLFIGQVCFTKGNKHTKRELNIKIYPNPDIAKFMIDFEKTQELGHRVLICTEEAIWDDGYNAIGVDAHNLRTFINKDLLRVLVKHPEAFEKELLEFR
jgi:hypothetical protein